MSIFSLIMISPLSDGMSACSNNNLLEEVICK